jgi:Transglycosylase SLT domain
MARIPTADALSDVPVSNVRQLTPVNGSALGAAGRAAQGLAQSGQQAVGALAQKHDADSEYEAQRRFIDFDLAEEQAFDEAKRSAPANPTGFADSFRQGYSDRAKQFFSTVPDNLKPKMDMLLARRRAQFDGQARTFETHGRDAYYTDDLSTRLSDLGNRAATAPHGYQADIARGVSLIDSAPIPAANKMKLRQKFAAEAEGLAIRSRIDRGEDLDTIIRELQGRSVDEVENPETRAEPFTPTPPVPTRSGFNTAVTGAIDTAAQRHGVDPSILHTFAKIESSGRPDAQTGSYKGLFQLSESEFRKHSGQGDIFDAGANADAAAAKLKAETETFQQKYGRAPSALDLYMVHQQGEAGYAAHAANPNAPAWQNMASTGEGRQKGAAWAKKAIWGNIPADVRDQFPGGVESVTSAQFMQVWRDKVERFGGDVPPVKQDTYTGPYRYLSPDQRLDLLASARTGQKRIAAELSGEVKSFESIAEKGYAPPADQVDALRAKVEKISDPEVKTAFRQAEAVVQWQNAARQSTPAELDAYIQSETERVQARGASPFDVKRLEMADKLLTTMRQELKSDPLGWGDRVGLVKVEPIDFSDPQAAQASLTTRVQQAEAVAARYGVAPKYLRPDEEKRLTSALDAGGDRTLATAGMIASAAGNNAPAILGEVSKTAPAAAIIGGLVADAGMTPIARDAAEGLALSKQPDFKSVAGTAKDQRVYASGVLGSSLARLPQTESHLIHAANLAYEVRARRQGLTDFDGGVWEQGLREIVGERDVGGELYGGIVDANPSAWSSREIIIPSFVKQDGWRQAFDALQQGDFERAGLGLPVGGDGQVIPMSRLRNATIIQTGSGRYGFSLAASDVPGDDKLLGRSDAPDRPFEIDLRELRPILSQRRPDLIAGAFDTDANPEARSFTQGN